MRVVHEPADGGRRVLATNAERADSTLSQFLGMRFRREVPEGYALVFEFGSPKWGLTDMLFVPVPLDVVWVRDGEVVRVERLAPWRGLALVRSDGFVEFTAGTADGVEPGDRLHVEDDPSSEG
jgi:uncharacterized membrane protein (UPF0127 family)